MGGIADITERMLAEEALRISERRLELALDATNLGLWDFNPIRLTNVHYNDRWFTMLGYEPDELPQDFETWTDLLHPEDLDPTMETLKEHLEGRREYTVEFRMRTKDGAYRWIRSIGKVIEQEAGGTPTRMIGVHMDITDERATEEERRSMESTLRRTQKMEAIGTLAGGIAHDFNNILTMVLGNAEMALCEVEESSPLFEYLDQICLATHRARDLVAQILTFSRKTSQEITQVELTPLVEEAVKMLRSTIPSSIEIREQITEETVSINADPTQVHQVIVTLPRMPPTPWRKTAAPWWSVST